MHWKQLIFSDDDIDRLDQRDPELIARLIGAARLLSRYHRAQVDGVSQIPDGPALYVANHNGGPDTCDSWIFGAAVYDQRGPEHLPFGLGHEWVLRARGVGRALARLGAVRASHPNAHRLFEAGHKVLVYPGGDEDSCRPFSRRHEIVFGGRQGYIRLALTAGVPVVPVVSCGAHSTWLVLSDGKWLAKLLGTDRAIRAKVVPLSLSVPWGFWIGVPPPYLPFPSRILIEVLPPIRFDRTGPDAANDAAYVAQCAATVETQMQASLTRLAARRRSLRR